jgi:hypothetical protein
MEKSTELNKKWAVCVAKAWADEDYKQSLLSNAGAVLKEEGIDVPEGINIKVVENTSDVVHMILPPAPDSEEGAIENVEERLAAMSCLCLGMISIGGVFVGSVVDSIVDGITGK